MRETAAAAIAVRSTEAGAEVCLFQAAGEQWSVPWSVVERGEVPKQTALRALRELGGVEASLTDVDPRFYQTIEQVYRKGIDKLRREVHFFRVRASHDAGPGAVWVPVEEAMERVTSRSVREVLEGALAPHLGAASSQGGGEPSQGGAPPPPPGA